MFWITTEGSHLLASPLMRKCKPSVKAFVADDYHVEVASNQDRAILKNKIKSAYNVLTKTDIETCLPAVDAADFTTSFPTLFHVFDACRSRLMVRIVTGAHLGHCRLTSTLTSTSATRNSLANLCDFPLRSLNLGLRKKHRRTTIVSESIAAMPQLQY